MCILFIHTNPSPPKDGYRLIVATNRDEVYSRLAQHAYHCPENNIIGGRDMEEGKEGGMWFGVSLDKSEQFALRLGCLLNLTGEEHFEHAEGRGAIVLNYLKGGDCTEDYTRTISKLLYRAYNFISIELSNKRIVTYHQSNRPPSCSKYEGEQVLAFGNSTTETPLQKVLEGKSQFREIVDAYGTATKEKLVERLTQFLKNDERHLPDAELRRRSPLFEHLSSIFVRIVDQKYGTRAHSIVLVDHDWNLDFIEIAMEQPIDAENPKWRTYRYEARL